MGPALHEGRPAQWAKRPGVARRFLRSRAWLGAFSIAAASAAYAQAGAQSAAQVPPQEESRDARSWLMRIHEAASRRNYQGTLVVTTAGSVSSSRVAHFCDGKQQYERVEALDGQARSMVRRNEEVHTLWPKAKVAVVEQRDTRASFPALLSGGGRGVLEWYELKVQGPDRIAGYDAEVVLLKARDAMRYSQRLWAERQTGLLLRSDTLQADGRLLESSAFSELAINVKPQPDLLMQPLKRLDGYRVLRPAVLPTTLEAEGWSLGAVPAGFKEVQCAKRSLDPTGGNSAPVVLQAIYSDGLTHVSLFIEPFQAQRHQAELNAAIGATHTLMVRLGDHWITVVGDVPAETLKRFVAALDRKH
ncbi:MAG TPA: MucB/RseB C-terminal domain-containing protein [Ideonella sp.]|nr:MucB/RseB C-terminal domain-containing protein [Ideonella sp.]